MILHNRGGDGLLLEGTAIALGGGDEGIAAAGASNCSGAVVGVAGALGGESGRQQGQGNESEEAVHDDVCLELFSGLDWK